MLSLLFDTAYTKVVAIALLLVEAIASYAIINRVAYTEIDWIAYMQEVAGPIERNDYDYTHLAGDTGPLVYPAGFVYLYSALYYLTEKGANIRLAQYYFMGTYLVFMAVLFALYKQGKVAPWVLIVLCLSRRIKSIFVLRLFNDCFAMLFLYAAILAATKHRWTLGSVLLSLGVSIKMNVLLFAPAFGLVMVKEVGVWGTLPRVVLCAVIQLVLAWPFLLVNPWGYVGRAFEFSRVFMFKWSVNLQFLREEVFVSKQVATVLLVCHLGTLALFAFRKWMREEKGLLGVLSGVRRRLNAEHIILLCFTCNFIGITFARSLHYQFYVWYFHTLPFMLHKSVLRPYIWLPILLVIEIVWNVYPPRAWASAALWACHGVILVSMWLSPVPAAADSGKKKA